MGPQELGVPLTILPVASEIPHKYQDLADIFSMENVDILAPAVQI